MSNSMRFEADINVQTKQLLERRRRQCSKFEVSRLEIVTSFENFLNDTKDNCRFDIDIQLLSRRDQTFECRFHTRHDHKLVHFSIFVASNKNMFCCFAFVIMKQTIDAIDCNASVEQSS